MLDRFFDLINYKSDSNTIFGVRTDKIAYELTVFQTEILESFRKQGVDVIEGLLDFSVQIGVFIALATASVLLLLFVFFIFPSARNTRKSTLLSVNTLSLIPMKVFGEVASMRNKVKEFST